MGTVDGLTKERMLQIEGASVVNGHVDGNGDLILERYDETVFNAGSVRAPNHADASTTVKGIIEIATLAEASTGTDTTRAMTPETVRQERDRVTVFGGVVSPTWSTGLVPVTVNPGAPVGIANTVVMCLPIPDDPNLQPGATVLITRTWTGTWVILGAYAQKPKFMKQVPLPLQPGSGWFLYSDMVATDVSHVYGEGPGQFGAAYTTGNNTNAGKFHLTCTSTGIVSLSGLLTRNASPAQGDIIATYPIEFAPERNQVFLNGSGSGAGNIAVCTDGTIRWLHGAPSYFALDNIRWRTAASVTAGTATFVPLVLSAGFAAHSGISFTGEPGSTVHTPGYTIDVDKVAIFEGAFAAVGAQAAPGNVSTLSGLTPDRTAHYGVAMSGSAFALLRIGGAGGAGIVGNTMNIGTAMASNQIMWLGNIVWLDSTSPTTTRVLSAATNSWVQYPSGTYALPAFAKTPDGLCLGFGLWQGGVMGQNMTYMPPDWRPRYSTILAVASNAAFGRVDIGSPTAGNGGQSFGVLPNNGSNGWFCLDGTSWPAYK